MSDVIVSADTDIEIIADDPDDNVIVLSPDDVETISVGDQGPPGPQGIQGPGGPQGIQGIPGPAGGSFPDAPSDGNLYGRINRTWAQTLTQAMLDASAVKYNVAQTLTYLQQDVARKNIGLGGAGYSNFTCTRPATNYVQFSADSVTLIDSAGSAYGTGAISGLTVDFNVSGGTGGGDLDQGSRTANTGYYYFVIYNPTTGALSGLGCKDNANPILPPGYTYQRRLGWLCTDASNNIVNFTQRGNKIGFAQPRVIATGGSGSTAISLGNWISPRAVALFGVLVSANNVVSVGDNLNNTICLANMPGSGQCYTPFSYIFFNAGLYIYYSSSSAGGQALITGFEDNI